ncbi:hypothetical protein ACSFA2_15690 [Variovorax sp. LT2P21]|uniref:hypothetical protein n=1 Tax=Variovorax sp. LT2P21 TaxID=3443731 RepID=UPI003F44CF23
MPLTLAEGEGGDSLCAEAEMVQGGVRVDDRRVTVSLEPGGRPGQTRIHIRSTTPIEEPVVQVTVRAGCQASSSRQFVLLADMPVEITAAPVLPGASGASSSATTDTPVTRSNRRPQRATGDGGGSAAAVASTTAPPQRAPTPRPRPAASAERGEARAPAARATPPARRSTAATPPRAPVPAAPPAAGAAAPTVPPAGSPSASGGARLQLDLLDPSAARNPALAASAAATPGALDPAVSAALAAASAAANAEELQRANERMKALEATLAALREQSAQNQRLLLEMRSELADARDSRYRNPLVYALGLLLLLALIGLFMLWRVARRTTGPAWWGDPTGKDDGTSLLPTGVASSAGLAGASVAENAVTPKTGPFGTALVAADAEDESPDTLPPLVEDESAPARYVNTEELFDVQQQSDFFLSLGQHEQAIAVLSEHIADNPETSALAYLDLLRIYHGLDRRDDYARVGQEFERAFNASVPDFEHFSEVGHGLEHYPSTLARIEAQWPRQGTLGLIEELVFRKPGTRGDESFDLAAYRELLLLYSVAKEVIDPDSAPPTPITPLSFLDTHEAKLEPTRPAELDRATEQVGLAGGDHNAPDAPLPSLYGAIDETLSHDTVIAAHPGAASARPAASTSASPDEEEQWTRPMSVNERQEHPDQSAAMSFDNTSLETLETLPAELELEKRPSSPPTTDDMPLPELRLDLELFDPTIEAEIAPRPRRRR